MLHTDQFHKNSHAKCALHLVSLNVPIVHAADTIRDVKKILVDPTINFDSINYIYVLNKEKHLIGVISVKEVMKSPEDETIDQNMQKDVVYVRPHTHQERAAYVAIKNSIKEIPVVDKEGVFKGVVLSDTILKITKDELTEDMLLLEGIYSKDYADVSTISNSPWHLMKKRLPWLIVGLGGGLFAAQVIGFFETLLEQQVILVSFLPLMVYMSDAIGSQSQTIFIRYTALNNEVSFVNYLWKEVIVGTFMAAVLAVLLGIFVGLLYEPFLGTVVGTALFFAIVISVKIAILIPWFLVRLHKDPAIGSGPFATIVRDILSILIYFTISSLMYPLV